MLGKKSSGKSEKNVVFIFTQISLPKNGGGKNAQNNFSRNTRIVRTKMLGKKSSEKSAKNVFLYSHEYRDRKMEGKKARNNFSRNTLIMRAKNVGKKIVGKKCKKRFFIFTRIS